MLYYKLEHFHKQEIVIKTQKYLVSKRINQILCSGENLQRKNNQYKSYNLKAKLNRKQTVKYKLKVI